MTGKIFNTNNLAGLAKRVPPNQRKQFEKFRAKTLDYHRKLNLLPDKLPHINWDYYRRNVRNDFVQMIEEFQVKYEELNRSFAKRHEILDHSKYHAEWQQLEDEIKAEVKEYIDNSVKRVRVYEEQIRYLKNLTYEHMTIEQFIESSEEAASLIPNASNPLFWPHTPEEQLIPEKKEKLPQEVRVETTKEQHSVHERNKDKIEVLKKDEDHKKQETELNVETDKEPEMPQPKN